MTIPLSDTDGKYTVNWGASATPGVTYVAEEATDKNFTSPSQIYSGANRSVSITHSIGGGITYYYRVKAQKTGSRTAIGERAPTAARCRKGQNRPAFARSDHNKPLSQS